MRRLILGDLHGHWKNFLDIYKKENPDEVICLGDYVDSFDVSHAEQEYVVKELFKLKDKHEFNHEGKFILLIGNHDFHYLYGYPQLEKYSGFSWSTFRWANSFFNNALNEKKIQTIFVDYKNKIIYSHAGISNTWINDWGLELYDINDQMNPKETLDCFRFSYTDYDPYGDSKYNGPLWIRPNSLINDMYHDKDDEVWTQIVGHTETKEIKIYNDNKLYLCDTINSGKYIIQELNDNKIIINTEIRSL